MQKACRPSPMAVAASAAVLTALLHGDGSADGVCPARVLKADGLDALDDLIRVKALGLAHFAAGFNGLDAVLLRGRR